MQFINSLLSTIKNKQNEKTKKNLDCDILYKGRSFKTLATY